MYGSPMAQFAISVEFEPTNSNVLTTFVSGTSSVSLTSFARSAICYSEVNECIASERSVQVQNRPQCALCAG